MILIFREIDIEALPKSQNTFIRKELIYSFWGYYEFTFTLYGWIIMISDIYFRG